MTTNREHWPVHVTTNLEQIDGLPMCWSQYDVKYLKFTWKTSQEKWLPLIQKMEEQLAIAKQRGAEKVIWRMRPQVRYQENGDRQIYARCHFLPEVSEGLDLTGEGEIVRGIST